jgi:ankyrin repeat protein
MKTGVGYYTPLHSASMTGEKEIVLLLISKGANVNAKNIHGGETPLGLAKTKEIAEIFINNGAKPAQFDLYTSAKEGNKEVVEFLISRGFDVNAGNSKGLTPLHMVGNREVAELLIKNGADINAKTSDEMTPLHILARLNFLSKQGNKETIELLIKKGADINARDNNGMTPLYMALEQGRGAKELEVAELLLKNGADVNAKDNKGQTILHKEVEKRSTKAVELLLLYGSKTDIKDKEGKTPLDKAKDNEIKELLLRK